MNDNLNDEAESADWILFGVAMNAMNTSCGGVRAFLNALEAGTVATHAYCKPPATTSECLIPAEALSPQWWGNYQQTYADHWMWSMPPAPSPNWANWLESHVAVQQTPTRQIFLEDLEEERTYYTDRRNAARSERLWSDLEVLAWFFKNDVQFASAVRGFGHQKGHLEKNARTRGLRYLRFCVALNHCRCGNKQILLEIGAFVTCTCVKSAWDKMVASLEEGLIPARLHKQDGSFRPISQDEFLMAEWNEQAGTIELLKEPGEVLFKQSDVQSFAATTNGGQLPDTLHNTTTPEPAKCEEKKSGGRPPGSGASDDEEHLAGMSQWLLENPKKSRRDAAKVFEKAANKSGISPENAIRRLVRKHRELSS